jgi:hypothetical protein
MTTILVEEEIDCGEVTCDNCEYCIPLLDGNVPTNYYCGNRRLEIAYDDLDLHCFTKQPMRSRKCLASTKND